MQNLKYGVCIRMSLGYCTIEWSQAETNSFLISGDASVIDPGITGVTSGINKSCRQLIIFKMKLLFYLIIFF